jgi:hypothetical protein
MVRFAFGDRRHESPGDVRQFYAELGSIRIEATDQVVFLISHNPWAGRIPVIPPGGVAEISGLHGASAVVPAIDLGVAVVEAATGIEVLAVDHPILTLRLIVNCGALRVVIADPMPGSINTP